MIRSAGATEVHMRVSCPPTISPCYYGVDTPSRKQLIAANKSVDEIRDYIGANSLAYLSLEWAERAPSECEAEARTLVTSKSGRLENKDHIKRRIDEATKCVDIEQICLSPQCGFASTEEGNILTEDEQWAKLRMIRELADEVWR